MTVLSRLLMPVFLGGMLAVAPAMAASAAVTSPAAVAAPASNAPYQGTLTPAVTSVPNGKSITFSYSVPSAGVTSTNWVGIYEPGQTPGQVGSATWQYTPDASGTVTFAVSSLDGVGSYVAYFLYDNGYQVIAGPVSFSVTPGTLAPAPVYQRAIGAHQMAGPFGVATDASGDIWATDTGRNQITEFDASGRPVRVIGEGAAFDQPPQGLSVPLTIGLSLTPLPLAIVGLWGIFTYRRRMARLAPAPSAATAAASQAATTAVESQTAAPVSCEMPDLAVQEPFAAVQQGIATGAA